MIESAPLVAQGKSNSAIRQFNPGDEIEYSRGSSWYPGNVIAIDENGIDIEYEWGSRFSRRVVKATDLRFAWEAKAITRMRFWSDASKKFRVRAAAIGIEDDKVRLHKVDGSEVLVPIAKLSRRDQIALKRTEQNEGNPAKGNGFPSAPELPETLTFTARSGFGTAEWGSASDLSEVEVDPPPKFASVPMKGVGFARTHLFESLALVEPIGGSDGWMFAGTICGQYPGRLLWASLSSENVKQVQWIPPGEYAVAVHPQSRLVLTYNGSDTKRPTLTVWEASPASNEATPKVRWVSAGHNGTGARWGSWADFISGTRVIHEVKSKEFAVWDFEARQEVYRVDQESFFGAIPTLSPGHRYLALPEDKRVRIIESINGRTVSSLPVQGGSTAGVGFNTDGTKLAILTRSQLAIWNVGTPNEPKRFRADTIGTPFSSHVEWVDDKTLLIDRSILYDLSLELPVWQYKSKATKESFGKRLTSVLDGKLCYAVSVGSPSDSGFIVGAVELPGPRVKEVVDQIDPDSFWVVKPGHKVRLIVDCGKHNQEVTRALEAEIAKNEWTIDPQATTEVIAKMGRSERQTIQYKPMFSRGNKSTMTASIVPFFSSLQVVYEGVTAWRSGSGSGLPSVMHLKKGETAQQKANELQRENPEFYQSVDIPDTIYDPVKKKGFGVSTISRRGLTPN